MQLAVRRECSFRQMLVHASATPAYRGVRPGASECSTPLTTQSAKTMTRNLTLFGAYLVALVLMAAGYAAVPAATAQSTSSPAVLTVAEGP